MENSPKVEDQRLCTNVRDAVLTYRRIHRANLVIRADWFKTQLLFGIDQFALKDHWLGTTTDWIGTSGISQSTITSIKSDAIRDVAVRIQTSEMAA